MRDLIAALPKRQSELSLVGYYRTERGETLRLHDNDRSLAEAFFGEPHQVLLVIQSAGFGPPNATFFFHDGDHRMADFSFLEFPFDPSQLANEERDRIRRKSQQTDTEPPFTLPDPAPPATGDHRKKRDALLKVAGWILAAVPLLAVGMLINTRWFRESSSRIWSAISNPPPAIALSKQTLGLKAERQNSDLLLTWNRESAAVLNAISGVLSIEEGGGNRRITLDPVQVRHGSILYAPATDQIQLQLTVLGPQGTAFESVIVILPKAGAPQVQALAPREVASTTLPVTRRPGPSDKVAGAAREGGGDECKTGVRYCAAAVKETVYSPCRHAYGGPRVCIACQ